MAPWNQKNIKSFGKKAKATNGRILQIAGGSDDCSFGFQICFVWSQE
jgi:hypothetical protein